MRRVPCVIWRGLVVKEEHIFHGTAWRAQRNAAMTGMEFHWHEVETWWDRLKRRLKK